MKKEAIVAAPKNVNLFTHTQPELLEGLGVKVRKNGSEVENNGLPLSLSVGQDSGSIAMAVEARKVVAARLGLLDNKDNKDTIDAEMARLSNALKTMAFGEMAKMATSTGWTGKAFRMTQAKNGTQVVTFSLKTAAKRTGTVTREALVKALAQLSEDEQVALLDEAEAAAKGLVPATEV